MGCVLYELYMLRSPFAGPGMNYYMLGHKLLRFVYDFCHTSVHCVCDCSLLGPSRHDFATEVGVPMRRRRHAVHTTSQHISRHFSSLQQCKLLDPKCVSIYYTHMYDYCRASHTGDACRGSGEGKREGDFI